jgi:hypothetical protein
MLLSAVDYFFLIFSPDGMEKKEKFAKFFREVSPCTLSFS